MNENRDRKPTQIPEHLLHLIVMNLDHRRTSIEIRRPARAAWHEDDAAEPGVFVRADTGPDELTSRAELRRVVRCHQCEVTARQQPL